MNRTLRILTTGENPLTLSAGKSHLGVDHDDDDDDILAFISAAFEDIETKTGRAYRATTATLYCDAFPVSAAEPLVIPLPSLQSVTSITYTDTAGDNQTLDPENFEVITAAVPAEVIPTDGRVWPVALDRRGSVVVTFAAGNAAACPAAILNAVRLSIDHDYHEHTAIESARIQQRIEDLVRPHRLRDSRLLGIRR